MATPTSDLFPQYGDDGNHFVIDDVTINATAAVPDGGSALAMFTVGMLGVGVIRRKFSL